MADDPMPYVALWANWIAALLSYRLARVRDKFSPEQLEQLGPVLATVEAEARTARRQAVVATACYAAGAILAMFHGLVGGGIFFAVSSARCWGLVNRRRRYPGAEDAKWRVLDLEPNNAPASTTFWTGAGYVLAAMSGLFVWAILR
jgi:hypothetical protein